MKIAQYGLDNLVDLPRLDSHDEEGDKGVSGKHPARSCRTGGRRKRPDCFPDKGAWQRSRHVDCGTGTFISWEYRPIRTLNALWRGRHEILPSAAQTAVFDRQPKGAGRRIPESDRGTQNNRPVSGLVLRYQLYPDRRRLRLPLPDPRRPCEYRPGRLPGGAHKKELVLKTLNAAQSRWHLPAEAVFHSDRGSQYTSAEVMAKVIGYGWKQSFSDVGKLGDNAWSESFFSILKRIH